MDLVSAAVGALLAAAIGASLVLLRLLPRVRRDVRGAAESAAQELLAREREELRRVEERLRDREDGLARRSEGLDERERELGARDGRLGEREAALRGREEELERTLELELRELERVAELHREEAEHLLLGRVEQACREEARQVIERAEAELRLELESRARDLLVTAMQRATLPRALDELVTTVPLPSDDLKGLLRGRDGRNLRAFEAATGVDVILDDTPGVVVISAFEPVRREVARRALVRLLDEGRIQPARIEQVVTESRQEMESAVTELGAAAAEQAGVPGLHPRLVTLLGRLEFLTSEGQNVRRHSVEVAGLSAAVASELGLDPEPARRAGLLHEVGKGIEHERSGDHVAAGVEFVRRCGEPAVVLDAIAAHHGQGGPPDLYGAVVQLACGLSSRRPGARDGSVEAAVRRRAELETLAARHPGVVRAWAMQAGRELRVLVDPGKVSDRAAQKLAREVAREVESAVLAPGAVRVTVVREVRHEETAR